jgi:Na+-transporting methylmalonyl-CoA/oxaloacetate decarboxylase beta subunit
MFVEDGQLVPLLGTIILGNLMRESGVVSRLTKAKEVWMRKIHGQSVRDRL